MINDAAKFKKADQQAKKRRENHVESTLVHMLQAA
jgi:hypothetical protein